MKKDKKTLKPQEEEKKTWSKSRGESQDKEEEKKIPSGKKLKSSPVKEWKWSNSKPKEMKATMIDEEEFKLKKDDAKPKKVLNDYACFTKLFSNKVCGEVMDF